MVRERVGDWRLAWRFALSGLVAAVLGSLAGVAVARRAGARWIGWLTALLGLVMVTPEIVNAVNRAARTETP